MDLYKQVMKHIQQGEYQTAIPIAEKAMEIAKRDSGELHLVYAGSVNIMGVLYYYTGKYEKAESMYLLAKDLRKKIFGENHPEYLVTLNNLAALYKDIGKYSEAEKLHLQVIEARKKILGEAHPEYGRSLINLAILYKDLDKYEKAEKLFIQGTEILVKTLGEDHADVGNCLNNLAVLYDKLTFYQKAEPLLLRAKNIREKQLGKNHPLYAQSLNNVAELYVTMGRYEEVEPMYRQALDIRRKVFGTDHPEYVQSLNNLANYYIILGQFEKAEPLLAEGRDILKRVLGENSQEYAACLNSLAYLYKSLAKFENAEMLMVQAAAIWKKILGEWHPDYASALSNLSILYTALGYFEKAEPFYLKAIEIQKKSSAGINIGLAQSLFNLAGMQGLVKKYGKADSLFKESGEIFGKLLGENHPSFAGSLNERAKLYMIMGQYAKAEPVLLQSSGIILQNARRIFTTLSEKERINYLARNILLIDDNGNLLSKYPLASPAAQINSYNLQLYLKAVSLADSRIRLEALQNTSDTSLRHLYVLWQTEKNMLARQYALPVTQRIKNLDSVEAGAEKIEKELYRISATFRNLQSTFNVSVPDVQKKLGQDEAAVEFIRFRYRGNNDTINVLYAASLLKKDDVAPQFIPLFEEKELESILSGAGKTSAAMVSSLYRMPGAGNKPASSHGQELYKLIWQPLEPYLKGIRKISYSPAGKLYGIAFHALPVDGTNLLIDKYQLNQYTSTRQVALKKENGDVRPENLVLFGDARFSMDSLELAVLKDRKRPDSGQLGAVYIPSTRGIYGNSWPNLPGTAEEVNKIRVLFDRHKITTESFVKAKATEEKLKALSGNSPQILHIATHGFFLPEPDENQKQNVSGGQNTYTLANDPLLRSGLILSGGNYAWSGKTPVGGVEDGIATAYEISQLNLSNTELVVLSACETALGDVKGSEGVFGLQRAFKMAGVKKMIVSLWKVPDKETVELMTSFYGYWLRGKTINDALAQAQADMRKKYPPFYWAAFVLVE